MSKSRARIFSYSLNACLSRSSIWTQNLLRPTACSRDQGRELFFFIMKHNIHETFYFMHDFTHQRLIDINYLVVTRAV
jgi:hypothetical protein